MMTRWRQPLAVACVALFVASCANTAPPSQAPASGAPASSAESPGSGTPTPAPGTTSVQQGLLLTKVLFAPSPGESGFIEISNAGSGPIDTTGVLLQIGAGSITPLSLAAPLLAPGAQLLILLDGGGSVEGPVIHAGVDVALDPLSDVVTLVDRAGLTLDRVAWGNDRPGAVPTGPGGVVPDAFAPGTSIGRAPGATQPSQGYDWVVNAAADASPGAPNPMPNVSVLLPLSGAVLDGSSMVLAWYPVPGAASYRVQIASEPSFAAPVFDKTTAEPQIEAGLLAAGLYLWRVQALAADGTTSRFSPVSAFELASAGVAQAVLALARTGPLAPTVPLALFADDPGKQLPVAALSQHKDTAMLLLEENIEKGAHAWDVDHVQLDPQDLADKMNCAEASVAMVNHFFKGDLSQDRIGYEMFKDLQPTGPERDLPWGNGLVPTKISEAMTFALGAPSTYRAAGQSATQIWDAVVASIKAGLPVVVAALRADGGHAFVFTGYTIKNGQRLLSMNDPWNYQGGPAASGKYNIDMNGGANAQTLALWLPPANAVGRAQESGVKDDTDKDGVVDFDETQRFHTDPHNQDTDGDKLPDKADIITGVFDPQIGYARDPYPGSTGRDQDSDNLPTERDPDSDGGGCRDGREDTNLNGHRDKPETWNLDPDDDACPGWTGSMTATETWTVTYAHGSASSSFNGLWEIDPAGDAGCPADSPDCFLYRPTGSISWTWDSHQTDPSFACDETTAGSLAAGVDPHGDQQVLHLHKPDANHFEYSGLGGFGPMPADAQFQCGGGVESGSFAPPRFFEILQGSSSTNGADQSGGTCYSTTWQIDTKADLITGSCFAYSNEHTALEFKWNLKRVGKAPGS